MKMENTKIVSIIVPIYNVEKKLDMCINSLVNQTYKNIEIILVDDGSLDNCPIICDNWSKKDNRIKVIHKKNGGVATSRNAGLDAVTGDYIGFVDGDDVVAKNMYEILVKLLESNDADISICNWSTFCEGNSPNYIYDEKVTVISGGNTALKMLLQGKISNSTWNKLYKKYLFNDIRFPVGFNYEDLFVIHKLIAKPKKIAITTSELYGYLYNRNGSIMNTCSLKNMEDYMKASNKRYDDLKNNKEVLYDLNISKAIDVFKFHIMATNVKDKKFFNSEKLLNEYIFLKQKINIGNIIRYLSGDKLRGKILKMVLLVNRDLFWKIRVRK